MEPVTFLKVPNVKALRRLIWGADAGLDRGMLGDMAAKNGFHICMRCM